jgi:hypothetical protein
MYKVLYKYTKLISIFMYQCQLTEFIQVKIVAVIQRGRFTVDVIPIVADLVLLIKCRVVWA